MNESEHVAALTVDVGNEIAMDTGITSSPIGLPSKSGSVAFSGAQYLGVWQDSRSGSPAIWATRMTTLGAISDGTAIRISAASLTGEQAEPTVAFIGGRYLVVWEDRGTGDLRAATVTTAGVVTQQGTVGTAGSDLKPRLAARGSEAVVAFESAGDVYAARFSGSSFASPFAVAATTNPESEPAVAANPAGGYLVTYTSGAVGARKLYGQLVNPADASPLSGAPIAIATGWRDHYQSDASFVGTNFVVVWNYRATRIGAARVSTAGVVLDTHVEDGGLVFGGIPISDVNSDQPSIACSSSSSKCFVSWRRRILGNDAIVTDVEGQLFDASLVASSTVTTVSGGVGVQSAPRVTTAASGAFFTAFHDDRHNAGGSVFGTRVSSTGAALDANGILVPRGYNHQSAPVAARSMFTWLVSWTDSRSIGNNVVGGRINNGGMSFDVPAFTIGGAQYGQGNAAVAVNGAVGSKQYFVVWADRQNRHADVYGSSVAEVPSLQVATNVTVASASDDQNGPEIASDASGGYLVTWQDRRNLATTKNDIYAAVLTSAGVVAVTDVVVSNAAGEQLVPQVAYDTTSDLYLLIWFDALTNTLYGARVAPNGSVLDPNGVALVAGAAMTDLSLAPGSDRFLAAWREGTAIRGARIRVNATEIVVDDAAGFTLASGAGSRKNPSIAYLYDTARTFYVVWADSRNGNMDIYGTSVLEETGGLGGEVAVSTGSTDETSPQLASGMPFALGQDVEVLLTYQRFDTTMSTQRVYVRKLSYSGF